MIQRQTLLKSLIQKGSVLRFQAAFFAIESKILLSKTFASTIKSWEQRTGGDTHQRKLSHYCIAFLGWKINNLKHIESNTFLNKLYMILNIVHVRYSRNRLLWQCSRVIKYYRIQYTHVRLQSKYFISVPSLYIPFLTIKLKYTDASFSSRAFNVPKGKKYCNVR